MTRGNTEWWKMRKQREYQLQGGSKHEKMEDGRRRGTVTGVFYGHSTQATEHLSPGLNP